MCLIEQPQRLYQPGQKIRGDQGKEHQPSHIETVGKNLEVVVAQGQDEIENEDDDEDQGTRKSDL